MLELMNELQTYKPERVRSVLLYPGITAVPNKWGKEIACSIIEFDRILRDAVALKRKGLPIRGKLSVVVFGKAQKSR